jgi:hypothetical protein
MYSINTWNNVAAGLSNCNTATPCFGDYPQVSAEMQRRRTEKKQIENSIHCCGLFFLSSHHPFRGLSSGNEKKKRKQIGANVDSIWVTTNQFSQRSRTSFSYAGVLITAFAVSNLIAGGAQTPFQTGSTALASLKPMVVSGPTANYPSGCVLVIDSNVFRERGRTRGK